MAHYMTYFDRDFLGAWDLGNREVTVTISKVAGETLSNGTKKNKKPVVSFVGKEKRMALNKTNCKVIAGLYGTDTRQWVGKKVILYATTTSFGSDAVECIRVKNQLPQEGKSAPQQSAPESTESQAESENEEETNNA